MTNFIEKAIESADEIVDWMPVSFNGDYPS
jgi:hypothetical protein